jgi:hypothetical protein
MFNLEAGGWRVHKMDFRGLEYALAALTRCHVVEAINPHHI